MWKHKQQTHCGPSATVTGRRIRGGKHPPSICDNNGQIIPLKAKSPLRLDPLHSTCPLCLLFLSPLVPNLPWTFWRLSFCFVPSSITSFVWRQFYLRAINAFKSATAKMTSSVSMWLFTRWQTELISRAARSFAQRASGRKPLTQSQATNCSNKTNFTVNFLIQNDLKHNKKTNQLNLNKLISHLV